METPKVSVIIPVYNGASYIGEAIESVLKQSYQNFELILVDDASTDNSGEVIAQFDDPRIVYTRNERNQGSNVTRNTGIKTATGELIAFLDQDDYYQPDKLQAHVDYYLAHPQVGLTYNARFELSYAGNFVYGIWRPPHQLQPSNFLLGFPVAPSDIVITRQWASRIGLMDERIHFYGGEYVLIGRLFIAGCEFGNIDRALNYRRRHSGRVVRDLAKGCESEVAAQASVFSAPGCTDEMMAQRDQAFANTYLSWGFLALAQEDTSLGQEYLRNAFHLNPAILEGNPCLFLENIVHTSVQDDTVDHEILLKRVLDQLPDEAGHLKQEYNWCVGRGYVLKGVREVIWGREEQGEQYFREAKKQDAIIDEALQQNITSQLLSFEQEFGQKATDDVIYKITKLLINIDEKEQVRQLAARININRAFQQFRNSDYHSVPGLVLDAFASDLRYMTNRGVLAILFRSLLRNHPA